MLVNVSLLLAVKPLNSAGVTAPKPLGWDDAPIGPAFLGSVHTLSNAA